MIWLPFDLRLEYPAEGIQRAELRARYGDAFHERLKQSFAASGLVYNPPPDVVPNTMRPLHVTELAREELSRPGHLPGSPRQSPSAPWEDDWWCA